MLSSRAQKFALVAVLTAVAVSLPAIPAQAGWWHWWSDCCPPYVTVRYPACAAPCCDWCGSPRVNCCWSCPGCYVVDDPCCVGGQGLSAASACCTAQPATRAPQSQPSSKGQAPAGGDSVLSPRTSSHDQPSRVRTIAMTEPPSPSALTTPASRTSAAVVPEEESTPQIPTNGAVLTATVPAEARVYVNGLLTKTTGTQRRYVTEGLLPGNRYAFRFEVVVERDGQHLSDTQVVQVRAGDSVTLDFPLADRRIAQR
jgi:uncharacterized protein (TIGR03000 family)